MERYPTALLDAARLPAPKQKMKTVIKEVWRQEPKLRGVLTQAYLHLSQFQDGIGDAILDCKLTDEMSPLKCWGQKVRTSDSGLRGQRSLWLRWKY